MDTTSPPAKCKKCRPDVVFEVKRFGFQDSLGCNSVGSLNALVMPCRVDIPVNFLILLLKGKKKEQKRWQMLTLVMMQVHVFSLPLV